MWAIVAFMAWKQRHIGIRTHVRIPPCNNIISASTRASGYICLLIVGAKVQTTKTPEVYERAFVNLIVVREVNVKRKGFGKLYNIGLRMRVHKHPYVKS